MTYRDDLEKLRKEAGVDVNNPTTLFQYEPGRNNSDVHSSDSNNAENDTKKKGSGSFTSEERKMSLWQKISLPFIRNSFMSVLFFVLITLIWIAISHTVVASINGVPRKTLVIYLIKDAVFMIVLAAVMYRLFLTQFSNTYHLEQDSKKALDEAKKWHAIQHSMMETIPETLVYTLDKNFCYTSFNNRHKYSMLRMWHSEIKIGDCLLDHITDETIRGLVKKDLEQALKGEYISQIHKFGDFDASSVYWQNYYAPILDEDKKIIGITCFATNITALKQSQNKNLFMSYHDQLTDLYNRTYAEGVVEQAERDEIAPYSVIVIDVMGMHQINDNYGNQTGDNLLIKVGEILTKAVKDSGVVARWGSDEFLILLPNTDPATCEALANICKCDFGGVTVNGVPLRAHIGFANRTDTSKALTDILRAAEQECKHSRP